MATVDPNDAPLEDNINNPNHNHHGHHLHGGLDPSHHLHPHGAVGGEKIGDQTMTRKHFIAIATILRKGRKRYYDRGDQYVIDYLVDEFTHYLSTQNPNFDRDRFKRACMDLK